MGHILELDHDLRFFAGQPFAGSQVERALPASASCRQTYRIMAKVGVMEFGNTPFSSR